MFKSRGRHARKSPKRRRPMLPLWLGALLQQLDALHEQSAATRAQLAEIARGGAL